MGDDTYGYAYDPIGNRMSATENTETTEYTANGLNQYSQISAPSVPSVVHPVCDANGQQKSAKPKAQPPGDRDFEAARMRGARGRRRRRGGNGNVTGYVATNGASVARREYDPFGRTTVAAGAMADDFNFWFSTKYLDHETGMSYYGYRFYAPELGRWLSRDPIEERGGLNLYGFVGNNPINLSDKLGLFIIRLVAGSPRTKTNPDGSFGGLWASVVILPYENAASLSGLVLHMKHTEIHVTDCDGKPIADSVQTVQKRIPTDNRAGWPLESGRFAPIYSNVASLGGYKKCVKGRILVKAVWYHFDNTGKLPSLGTPILDKLSGSLDNQSYPHGSIGSTSGWPSVSSGSYSDFGSLSIEIQLNCSSPFYDIHAVGRGLDSTHMELRKDRWSDMEGSEEYGLWNN